MLNMKNCKKHYLYFFLIVLVTLACGSNDNEENVLDDFPSFGLMEATINGKRTVLSAKMAKQFSSPYLQIAGTNCSERIIIAFAIPFTTGNYSLETLGEVFVFLNSALACEGDSGSSSVQSIIEAEVIVTELTATRVKGSFSIIAGEDELPKTIITDGIFDVERE